MNYKEILFLLKFDHRISPDKNNTKQCSTCKFDHPTGWISPDKISLTKQCSTWVGMVWAEKARKRDGKTFVVRFNMYLY